MASSLSRNSEASHRVVLRTMMDTPSDFPAESLSPLDVRVLGLLAAATEQDHGSRAARCKVNAIARPIVDAHLANPAADRLDVAGVSLFQPANARCNTASGGLITKARKPCGENACLADLNQL